MPTVIEIEGSLVRVIDKSEVYTANLEDVLPLIETKIPTEVPSIPRSAVYLQTKFVEQEQYLYVLSEIPPAVRRIRKDDRLYRLSLPWTYIWYVCRRFQDFWEIDDYRCLFALDKYQNPDSPMMVACLPNLYDEGRICFGQTGVDSHLSLADRIDQLTNEWYVTRFNSDLDSHTRLPYGERNMRRWVTESAENSLSWRNWPEWQEENNTRNKITVNSLLGETSNRPVTITTTNTIPEINTGFTFGRAEEWLGTLPPNSLVRLRVALANYAANAPEAFNIEEMGDDGGEPVT